jgi:hypothetical protein
VHILKTQKRSQISDPLLHLKLTEKQEQAKPKASRKRNIIKTMADLGQMHQCGWNWIT